MTACDSFVVVIPSMPTTGFPHFLPISTHFNFGPGVTQTSWAKCSRGADHLSSRNGSKKQLFIRHRPLSG
jgi:hypothetical protein